jgi:hypothetical protein
MATFVISKDLVVIISLNLLQKRKDISTSNAWLRMDCESAEHNVQF